MATEETTVYVVLDEITSMGNRVFFKKKKAQKYAYLLVKSYRDRYCPNPDEEIKVEQGGDYASCWGRKAEVEEAEIKLPKLK
jgi:hypothetical protein